MVSNSKVIKICSKFKQKWNCQRVYRDWGRLHLAQEKHFPDIFQQLSADLWGVRMREKAQQGEKQRKEHLHEPSCCMFCQTLSQNLLCNSFMCYRWHNSCFFFHQPLYMINKTMLWKHWDLSSMSLWKGPR